MRLIDGDELYKAMKDAEDLARKRVLDTESTLPYPNNLNPSYTRYLAQMDERTKAKHMIADAPAVDAVSVVRCLDCKFYYRMTAETGICQLGCPHLGNDGFCSEGERKGSEQNDTK